MYSSNPGILRAHDPTDPLFWEEYFPSLKPLNDDWRACWESYWRFFLERTWFHRAWTYQEALLAQEACFNASENMEYLHYDSILALLIILESIGWRAILFLHFGMAPLQDVSLHPSKDLLFLNNQRRDLSKYISRTPQTTATSCEKLDVQAWLRLWSLLFTSMRSRSCFLEPDKINATFGIANITRPTIIPESVFHETTNFDTKKMSQWMTSFFLQRRNNLDQLSFVGPLSFERRKGMPSWVVDYSEGISWSVVTQVDTFDASLTRTRGSENYVKIENNSLAAKGMQICTVKKLIPANLQRFPEWCLTLCWSQRDKPEYAPTNESFGDALWKTLLLGIPSSLYGHQKSIDTEDFKNWIQSAYITKWLYPQLRHPTLSEEDELDAPKYLESTSISTSQKRRDQV